MKIWTFVIFAWLALVPMPCTASEPDMAKSDNHVFVNPDFPARYLNRGEAGLLSDLYSTLAQNINETQDSVQSRAVVSFKISKEGYIKPETIKVVRNRSVPEDYLNAAIEAIKKLGKFVPAKRYDTPLPVTYNFPILYPLPSKYITE